MKDHSSFVACIPSFSLTTISETSTMDLYYLSIWVGIKLGFINRLAVYMSNLRYCLHSMLLWKSKRKCERTIFPSRGHRLIFICPARINFALRLSFWKLGKRKRVLPTVLGFLKMFLLNNYLDQSAMCVFSEFQMEQYFEPQC